MTQRNPTPRALQFPRFDAVFLLFVLLGTWVCLRSLRYYLPHVPFPSPLPNVRFHRSLLLAHGTAGVVALLLGPWQFLAPLRARYPALHRLAGRLYIAAAAVSSVAAIALSFHAATGWAAGLGFLTLGAFWIGTTAYSVKKILAGDVIRHREWMARSYALILSAVTLRFYVPVAHFLHIPFGLAYPSIAWLCWLPNLIAVECLLRRAKRGARADDGRAENVASAERAVQTSTPT